MRIEVLAIGGEIVKGIVVNSNAAFISRFLTSEGWDVHQHSALPDNASLLKDFLAEAWKRADCILITGGLGPTCDDLTRNVLAEMFSSKLIFNEKIAEDLKKRYGSNLASLQDQATVPEKAQVLINPVGTASGLLFEEGGKCLIAMPGVPSEMGVIFQQSVLPYLRTKFAHASRKKEQQVHLCMLSESNVDPVLNDIQKNFPQVDIGIYTSDGLLSVIFSGEKSSDLNSAATALTNAFSTQIYSNTSVRIEEELQRFFITEKLKLGVAESCTGGTIASRLTSQPGSSEYFLGSIVSYSNAVKRDVLKVPEEILERYGAVSQETAEAMALGVFKIMDADWSLAVTGIAGPSGGTEEKPVGTVWISLAKRNHPPESLHFKWRGTRQKIITIVTNYALSILWRRLIKGVIGP